MKNYLITVNGTTYEVQVEELDSSAAPQKPAAVPAVTKAAATPAQKPAAAPAPAVPATGKVTVKSPMPGNIVKINVAVGDEVKTGTILCILEAMKMENEIRAPQDGVIASVNTAKGATVNSNDILFSIS